MTNQNTINLEYFKTKSSQSSYDYFDKLSLKAKENYLIFYKLYSDLLYRYLIEKLKLNTYDEMIRDARNHFEPVNDNKMDFYQLLAKDYLKYFYIRNNLYIERLTNEELTFLRKKIEGENLDFDEESKEFIQKTYPKVIAEIDDSKDINVNYGPDNVPFYKSAHALIIGVRFDDYYLAANETEEEWNNKYPSREFELENITFCLEKSLEKFEVKGYVIRYNDFSIIPLVNEKEKDGK